MVAYDGNSGHEFSQLLGSDEARFAFYKEDKLVLDFTMDYLFQIKPPKETPDDPPTYDSGVYIPEPDGEPDGEEEELQKYGGSLNTGELSFLIATETSLDYNINTFFKDEEPEGEPDGINDYTVDSPPANDDYEDPDPLNDDDGYLEGWIYEVIYEFKIDGDAFDNMSILKLLN